ncbi:Uncharacterized protein YxjI [Halovenus aranensis]|jgi:uncharacterized protein YxjI|uniref:Uncharacterized protein YxjI n=1 Tax=Halovenus aranensis TaxID=890420 RepID=A0A1G8VSR1_9EURY|nr:hypothetical protein [Halovenus aranensis]SDJ68230.1 Uncharacterized protein YxjI [Halovenus aranensis]
MGATTRQYQPETLALSGSQYTVEQTGTDENMRPEYEATDAAGETVFSATYEMYQTKDSFAFFDGDGEEIVTVTATSALDMAGDYTLTDTQTGQDLVVLENDFSLLRDTWRIRDADDGSVLAELTSRGGVATVARTLLPFGRWLGHEYTIADRDGEAAGTIESGFGILDEYEVTIADTSSVPQVPVVVGVAVIDGIQAN